MFSISIRLREENNQFNPFVNCTYGPVQSIYMPLNEGLFILLPEGLSGLVGMMLKKLTLKKEFSQNQHERHPFEQVHCSNLIHKL